MDRLFLDANILFSAAYKEQTRLAQLWSLEGVELLTSLYALSEARRNLREREQHERLDKLVRQIAIVATPIEGAQAWAPHLAEKDQPILAAAILAKATCLLTGDLLSAPV